MPPSFIRQVSFKGGELAPCMWGRSDLELFGVGLRTCRNFFIEKHGMAVSRPGSTFVGYAQSLVGKLIPFLQDDRTSFVCEFGANGKIAFHQNGAPLLSGGVPYTVPHPYVAADLPWLQWSQVGDIITITHRLYAPMELRRFADTAGPVRNWTFSAVAYANTLTPWWRDTDALVTVTLPPMIVNVAVLVPLPNGASVSVGGLGGDATHPPREWVIQATQLVQHTVTGRTFETLPFTIVNSFDGLPGNTVAHADAPTALPAGNMLAVYPDRPLMYRRATGVTGAKPADADSYKVLATIYYRGRGNLMGFIGSTKSRDFIDTGAEPDYTIQPPQGTDPFTILDNLGVVSRVEHPASVAFFQERRLFAGTFERGGFIFASATGDYTDFDSHVVQVSGEALIFELAARRRERIVSLASVNRVVALTMSSIWSIGGTGNQPLDFDSVDARLEEEIGSIGLPPLVIENALLYCRAKGAGVRSLVYDARSLTFQGRDVSDHASHLFIGQVNSLPASIGGPTVQRSIVDWTYAEDPWRLIWAVRSDGALLSLSYGEGQEAWARHDTNGYYRSICAVPEGDEDAVYVLTVRPISGGSAVSSIERFTSRHRRGNAYDEGSVDCAKLIGPIAPTAAITGLAHLETCQVYVVSVGNTPYGPLTVVGGAVTLPEVPTANHDPLGGTTPTQWVGYVGLAFTPEFELLDVVGTDVRAKQKTLVSVTFEVDQSRGLSVGQDFDNLTVWEQRAVSNNYGASPAATALVRLPIKGTWDKSARACLRQTQPLPVTVLGITREVDVGQ